MKDNNKNTPPSEVKADAPASWRAEYWLDYAENEVDHARRAEMKSLLKKSEADRKLVQDYQETRAALEAAEPELPEISEDFLNNLHDKIMANVAETEIRPAPKILRKASHRKWAATASSVLSFLVLAVGFYSFNSHYNKSHNTGERDLAQQLIEQALESPEDFAQFVSYQDSSDFFVDVASRGADDLSIDQFDSLMGKARQ